MDAMEKVSEWKVKMEKGEKGLVEAGLVAAPPIIRVRLVFRPASLERGSVKLNTYELPRLAVQGVETYVPEFTMMEHWELAAVVSNTIAVGK